MLGWLLVLEELQKPWWQIGAEEQQELQELLQVLQLVEPGRELAVQEWQQVQPEALA